MTIKTRYVIIGVIALFIATFFVGKYLGRRKAINASEGIQNALNNEIVRHKVKILKDSVYIAEVSQEITTLKEAKKIGDIKIAELKALNIKNLNELSRLKFRIDTLLKNIPHTGEIEIDLSNLVMESKDSTNKHNSIRLPFKFGKQDEWLTFHGVFDTKGILDMDIKMDIGIDVWTGYKKKDKNPSVLVTTDNPYINTLNIRSQKFDFAKPKKYNVSLFMGYGLTKNFEGSPVLGIGIGRSIFRF